MESPRSSLGRRLRCVLILLAILFQTCLDVRADDASDELFERRIRPLLIEECQQCHGEKKQEAGLRLDSRQSMLQGGDSGSAIVPGKASESLLIAAVRYLGDVQMPPKKHLSDPQIEALERWIDLGAPWPADSEENSAKRSTDYRSHWAFQPIADQPTPEVTDTGHWARNEIDRFVLAKLQSQGMMPQRNADRRTLLRRVYYDLVGLPPTTEAIEKFEDDPLPDAYERVVEKLLDSRQYAEHWARLWLDVARYSDSKGYVYGREERFWIHAAAYRDWVIEAFEKDMPYDRFVMLQLAADQVAPEDRSAQAAMGYLTLGRRFLGVTHDIIDDRIDVVSRGLMGLTAACARCHDHKYDPVPTADYYSLYGVFMNSREQIVPLTDPIPESAGDATYQTELAKRQEALRDIFAKRRDEAATKVRARIGDYLIAQTELSKYPQEGFDTVIAPDDLNPTFVRRWEAYLLQQASRSDRVFELWRRLVSIEPSRFADESGPAIEQIRNTPSAVNERLLQSIESKSISTLSELAQCYGAMFQELDQRWKAKCDEAVSTGSESPKGFDDAADEELRQVLYGPESPCVVPDESVVSTEMFFDSGVCVELWKYQGELERWLIQSPDPHLYAIRLIDRVKDYPAFVFRRGNPANRKEPVRRHFFSFFANGAPNDFQRGSGRLEFAQAIVAPENPLTARVWVNRIWQAYFGTGLVKTASDFGMRAEPPSHPELLDWLAKQLIAEGWSTKQLHRRIVLSSTYRQSSLAASQADSGSMSEQKDPENRLLSRMNRKRLTFEEFRDSLLQIAGRLDVAGRGKSSDLFASLGTAHRRRTIYGLVDRQFLSSVLRVFDFANPDLHNAQRSETTVPQQALFAMNHPFLVQQARAVVARDEVQSQPTSEEKISQLYRLTLQRGPAQSEQDAVLRFVSQADNDANDPAPTEQSKAWSYGYGTLDPAQGTIKDFKALPYFSGKAWSGGSNWPDAALGWVQLHARGGHPGNDLQHASVRRWTAPRDGTYRVQSEADHSVMPGDGVRCSIICNGSVSLLSSVVHHRKQALNVDALTLKQGDTLDFVVDINQELNTDQHEWIAAIIGSDDSQWNSERDFFGPQVAPLNRWEQFAQVLLMSNELMFVD